VKLFEQTRFNIRKSGNTLTTKVIYQDKETLPPHLKTHITLTEFNQHVYIPELGWVSL